MMCCKSYPEGFLKSLLVDPSMSRQGEVDQGHSHNSMCPDPLWHFRSPSIQTPPYNFLLHSDRGGFNVLCLFSGSSRNGSRGHLVLKRERGDLLMLEDKCC